jgi:putative spermidine/putrescine transport system permease protein
MFEDKSFRLFVNVAGWAALLFLMFPVFLTVVVSFNGSQFIEFPPKSLSLEWYANIASIHRIGTATLISLGIGLLAAGLATVFAIGAALVLVRFPLPAKPVLTAFLLSPVTVPTVAIGIALIQFFILMGVAFTWYSLVIGHVILVIAYPVRTLVASLTLSNISLEEAAASLGAGRWTVFRTITLPQLRPGLISGFLFAFLISFDNYPISIFLVRGELTTMPIEVFNHISQNLDPTPAAFSTLYIVIVSLIITLAERRYGIISLAVGK